MPAAEETGEHIGDQIGEFRRWATAARTRAARAEAAAGRHQEQAALLPAELSAVRMRLAALQRQVRDCHLASAKLHDQYADRLVAWLARPGRPTRRPRFIEVVAAAIGTPSATVTLLGKRRGEAVMAASDATARAANDLEFVLGQGPSRLAIAGGQAVSAVGAAMEQRWPQYGPAVARVGVHAVLAVPLQPPAGLGALCAYNTRPAISDATLAAADALSLALSQAVPRSLTGGDMPALPLFAESEFAAVVHQAAGMVSRQCGCSASDALVLLRARAFASARPAEDVAADVVTGTARLC